MRYYVLARSYNEYLSCCVEKGWNPRQHVYLHSYHQLKGIRLPKEQLIKYGDYHLNRSYNVEFYAELQVRFY